MNHEKDKTNSQTTSYEPTKKEAKTVIKNQNHQNYHTSNNSPDDASPNSPHPSIEYPPLYFLLKPFPNVWNAIYSLYRIRWEVRYPLQRRVPFSNILRKIGVTCTWGELLLWLPFMLIATKGIVTSFVYPSVSKSGIASRLPLLVCFLTANHNSLLTLILGIPLERAIKYHKVSGYLAFLNGIFHTIVAYIAYKDNADTNTRVTRFASDGQANMSGTLLLAIILAMIVTASPYVRRKAFEVFYYCHIFFAMAMMGCAFYHSGLLVPILASVLWGGDLFMRLVYMAHFRYPSEATIIQLTDTVVEIRFPKTAGFDYNPGQYVKIAIPEISVFQWHPISISSSPHQHVVSLHIRKRGEWTKQLHGLAQKKDNIRILLEGPYGSLGVDLTSDRYSMVMLLSGGIGVTPMQSIAHQLMYEHEWEERELKKVWFIWTARDPQVMSNMDVILSFGLKIDSQTSKNESSLVFLSNLEDTRSNMNNAISINSDTSMDICSNLGIISQLALAMIPPSISTDEDLEKELSMNEYEEGISDDDETHVHENEIESGTGDNPDVGEDRSGIQCQTPLDEVLQLDCYITAEEMNETGLGDLWGFPCVHQCRPDMKGIFMRMREDAKRQGERKVAVCVCAPTRLVDITRKACVKFSDREVRFDFHSEVFE